MKTLLPLLALLLCWAATVAWAAPPPTAAPASAAASSVAAGQRVFSVTEIIPQGERALERLRQIRQKLESDRSESSVEAALPGFKTQLDARWKAESLTGAAALSTQRVNDVAVELQLYAARLDAWRRLLADSSLDWAAEAQGLREEQATWTATLEALDVEAPPVVRERVTEVQREIAFTQQLFRDKTLRLVSTQDRVAAQNEALQGMLRQFDSLRRESGRNLLSLDSPPLWTAVRNDPAEGSLATQIAGSAKYLLDDALHLVDAIRDRLLLHVVALAALVGLLVFLRRYSRAAGKVRPTAAEQLVVDRSLSSAFIVWMIGMALLSAELSPQEMRLVLVPGLLAVLRLTPAVVPGRLQGVFYAFLLIYLLDLLRSYLPPQWLLARLLLLLVSGLGAAGVALLLARQWRGTLAGHWRGVLTGQRSTQVEVLFLVAMLVPFVGALVANVAGNLSLAEYLTSPILRLVLVGVAVRLLVVAASIGAVMALSTPLALRSRLVLHRGAEAAVRLRRLLVVVGVLCWIYLALFNLGLLSPLQQLYVSFMKVEWTLGAAIVSVRDISIFLAVLFGSYIVSRALRLFLADELLPRIHLPRGVPDALTLLARYGVLLFGFLLALTSAGVDVTKLTIAVSALGVGIGFGLQTVVSNFVSGLILVFEHPIQVGDVIEVGPHYGQVSRIGFRASMLLTHDGSEVVIPNAELIGNKVVNWSLASGLRRLRINVPVAAGTDSRRVIELLESVARACPLVRADPPPRGVLEAFHNGQLHFQLRCWMRTEDMPAAQHALTLAIDQAFREAGIEMPLPASDVRLHFPDEPAARTTPTSTAA